jgi:hypothetical protein
MFYKGCVGPRGGAISVLLSSQQEAVVCGVFRKEVVVMKDIRLRVAEIENVAV